MPAGTPAGVPQPHPLSQPMSQQSEDLCPLNNLLNRPPRRGDPQPLSHPQAGPAAIAQLGSQPQAGSAHGASQQPVSQPLLRW